MNKQKFMKINQVFTNTLSGSTIHAVPNIIRANNALIKFIWFVFLIISMSACGYFLYKNINDYLEYNPVTVIETLNVRTLVFPAVSICGVPAFNQSLNETFTRVEFNQETIFRTNTSAYFEEFIDPRYGKCFRFNSGKNMWNREYEIRESTLSGRLYGLTIKLMKTTKNNLDKAILYIHNNTENPLSLNNKGFEIYAGVYNNFLVEKVITQRLDSPYSDCLNDPTTYTGNKTVINSFIKGNRSYTQKNCIEICRNLKGMEINDCGCKSDFETFDINCFISHKNSSSTQCLKDFSSIYQNSFDICLSYCPLECNSVAYNIIPFMQPNLPNVTAINANISKSYDEMLETFLFTVYFEDLKYTRIKEVPKYEISDLVSNVGGILGLFLGFSFLSLIEIVEIIMEIFFVIFDKNNQIKDNY